MKMTHFVRPTLIASALIATACGGAETTTDASDASSGSAGTAVVTGSGGSGNAGSSGTGGTTGAGGGSAGAGGTGSCNPPCFEGRTCCGGKCINPSNDPTNCGECNVACKGAASFCGGTCQAPPCELEAGACAGGSCCGSSCCSSGQLCCDPQGPIDRGPVCFTPTAEQPSCPMGCSPLCQSDRALKREVEPIDRFAVLDAVSRLPISTWSYKSDPSGVRHLGPMAQDFKEAFGLGDTDRGYYSVDAHGVSLAAIQALYERSLEQSRRIDRLERENRELHDRLRKH